MKINSKLRDNKLKNSHPSYQTHFLLPHLSTRWSPVLECLFVCVWQRLCVLVMDRMQECNTGWRKEREVVIARYIRSFGPPQLSCTVLWDSVPPSLSIHLLIKYLDQELQWLSLCCLACWPICLPLVILTAVRCFFIVYPRNESHDEM